MLGGTALWWNEYEDADLAYREFIVGDFVGSGTAKLNCHGDGGGSFIYNDQFLSYLVYLFRVATPLLRGQGFTAVEL